MAEAAPDLDGWTAGHLARIGTADPAALLAALKADHERAETPYHAWSHIAHGLGLLRDYEDLIPEFDAVLLAWLNHDRVYDPRATDNEDRSADQGRNLCAALDRDDLGARVAELILDTKHQAAPATSAGRWLVGIDLAILGETPERFARFEEAIRTEYAHVPAALYRVGRGRILRGFLERGEIYEVAELKERFEAQARANLTSVLAEL